MAHALAVGISVLFYARHVIAMPVSPNIIHVESPYTIRNLRNALEHKQAELVWDCRSLDPNDIAAIARLQGHLNGLDDALNILDEMEKREKQ